jgi:membrane-bound lytic murein transglycosylase B
VGPDRGTQHRWRIAALTVAGLAAGLAAVAGTGPDAAAGTGVVGPPSPDPMAGQVVDAQAAARTAAHRVDGLRTRYLDLSGQATEAARRLARAFADQARLASRHDTDAAALAHAQAVRVASIRAVYADGGRLGLLGSVLEADSPDDALWRLSTATRIQSGVLQADRRTVGAATAQEAQSQQAVDDAARSDAALTQALSDVQNDLAAADDALAGAEAELGRLNGEARRLATAQEAAKRLAEAKAAAESARLASATGTAALPIPPAYQATYRAAATTCPGMDWTLLAAVGQVESGHGRNNGPSSAGAIGPMQFMPATFAQYAVDGNQDGVTDAWDYHDAISTAAAYLCASGARGGTPEGTRTALFAYNHAQWYVDLVLAARAAIVAKYPD